MKDETEQTITSKDSDNQGSSDESKEAISILIVDDDQFLLDMYSMKFKESGFKVASAVGGLEAIAKLKEEGFNPKVILLDLVMPAIDGFELLKRITEEGLKRDSMIIVLSNLGQPADVEKGKVYGISDYIIKANATPSEVVKRVQENLEK